MKSVYCNRFVMAFGIVVCLACASLAQDAPTKVATIEGISEYRFNNGAKLVLFPDNSRPTISVNMTVLVGSRHEGYGEAGMAHLLEHLVFKGTPSFPDVPKVLRDHGANYNGTTNDDRTNYFETLPASDENLEFAIRLECDRLVNSYIRRSDLLSEFTVVRNEFERGENSPEQVLDERVRSAAYDWHNYGKSTIGNRSDIERVPIDRLMDFYRKYYQPDNAVLIVTGQFEENKALALATKYLGALPKPERKLEQTYTEEPPQDGERQVTLYRVGSNGAFYMMYHIPAVAHPDWAPLEVLGMVLSEAKVGTLAKELVETKLATSTSAGTDEKHDPGLFVFYITATPNNLDTLREKALQIADRLADEPIDKDAVERAKLSYMRTAERRLANPQGMSSALSHAASLGDWRLHFIMRDRIAQVTADDIQRVAKAYLRKHNRTIGTYVPSEAPQRLAVPTVPSLSEIVDNYRGGESLSTGEAFDTSYTNLEARTKMFTSDGVQYALLQKENRADTVTLEIALHFGNEDSLNGKAAVLASLGPMLMAGTDEWNRATLRQKMNELGVIVNASGGRGQLNLSITGKRDNLLAGIELLTQIVQKARFPEDEFDQGKLRSVTRLQAALKEPSDLASNFLARALSDYPGSDIRYIRSIEESIVEAQNAKLAELVELYRQQITGKGAEVAIVGEFDPDKTVAAVKSLLKDWTSETEYRSIDREVKKDLDGLRHRISTPDKANAVFVAGLSFPLTYEHEDNVSLTVGNVILGGSTLTSRLGNRIRQKEGLSYGVNSSVSVPMRGNDARFTISAITNPQNIDKLEAAAMEELNEFLAKGPTEAELEDGKKAILESQKVSRTGDSAIASLLITNMHYGRTFDYLQRREDILKSLKPEDVRQAFVKHINPRKLVIIHAGDFGRQ